MMKAGSYFTLGFGVSLFMPSISMFPVWQELATITV